MENAYSRIISSVLNSAQGHADLADALGMQVVEVLKGLEKRNEEHRKKVRTKRTNVGLNRLCNSLVHSIKKLREIGTDSYRIASKRNKRLTVKSYIKS